MDKGRVFLILKYGLLVMFLIGFALYFKNNSENFNSLKEISGSQFGFLFLMNFVFYLVNGLITNSLLRCFNIDLKIVEQFYLSVLTTFGNYFLPFRGGAALRGIYLKKNYQFTYSRFMVAMMAQLLVVLLVALIAMFLFSLQIFLRSGFQDYQLTLALSGMLGLVLVPLFFSKKIYQLIGIRFIRKILFPFYQGWHLVCKKPVNLLRLFFYSCLNLSIISLMLYAELIFLGMTSVTGQIPGFFDALFLSVFNLLSSILIITPGAIGIRESMMMAASNFISITPHDVLVASVLDRSVNIIFIILAFFASSLVMKVRSAGMRQASS